MASLETSSDAPTNRSNKLWLIIRTAIGIILIVALIPLIANPKFWTTLSAVNVPLVVLSILVSFVATATKAWRWGIVMRSRGINRSWGYFLSGYFIGIFFNNFLPSGMGGDIIRAYEAARETGKGKESVVSVVIERGSGMLALFGTGSLFALTMSQKQLPLGIALLAHGLFVGALVAVTALWQDVTGKILAVIGRRLPKQLSGLWATLTAAYEEFRSYRHDWRLLGSIMWRSLITLILTQATVYLLLLAFNDPVPFGEFAAVFGILAAIDVIPISLNGLGVREGAYVFFFGLIGIAQPVALGVALMIRLTALIQAACGGIAYLWRNFQASRPRLSES